MVGGHHVVTLYLKYFSFIVSATVGMSATVEEMSVTVEKLNMF